MMARPNLARRPLAAPLGITPRQREARDFIAKFERRRGCSPSYLEIATALGVSKSTTHDLVGRLVERGHVRRLPGQKRGVTVVLPSAIELGADAP